MDTWITTEEYHACNMRRGDDPCPDPAYWDIVTTGADLEHREETEISAQTCREHLEFRLLVHELLLTGTYHHVERHYI